MKVLITGGAGFIGGHLAASLAADGHRVDILDSFARGVRDAFIDALVQGHDGRVRVMSGDLLAADSLASADTDYDVIYHLAAIIGVQHVLKRPYAVLTANVEMTDRVLALATRQAALKRFVFASTSEVYAGTLLNGSLPIPTPEAAPIVLPGLDQPRTSYMLSKLYGEAMCHASGVPVSIVRPHNVYGPRMGMSHVIPELLQRAHRAADGAVLEVFSIDHTRTFCYVDDAVSQVRAIAESRDAAGVAVNVGTSQPECSIGELARLVVAATGRNLRIAAGPTTEGSPSRRCPDTSLVDRLSGITTRVALADGIARTYAWYKETVFASGGSGAI